MTEAQMSRLYADWLRAKAYKTGLPIPHVCGASGFGYSDTDICPACEDLMNSFPTIGIRGDFGAGKDEVAKVMVEEFGYTRFAFGDDLKTQEVEVLNDPDYRDEVWDEMPESARDAVLTCLALAQLDPFAKPITPEMRELHQQYGTDFRRAQDPDYWVKKTASRVKQLRPSRVFFSDLRFRNEVEYVRNRGGLVWEVVRPKGGYAYDRRLNGHRSERELDGVVSDAVILNDGTLADLCRRVRREMGQLRKAA